MGQWNKIEGTEINPQKKKNPHIYGELIGFFFFFFFLVN